MQKRIRHFIISTAFLMLASSGIYFLVAYAQMQESSDVGSKIQTLFFTTAGVTYLPIGIWVFKNKLYSRAPYVMASTISVALIALYVISRTVNLPIVGIQQDIGVIDILSKVIQASIIATSTILIRVCNKESIVVKNYNKSRI